MIVEAFVPRRAAEADLAAWCALFSEGHSELSGDSPRAAALAERLPAEPDTTAARRWAARGAGADAGGRTIVGVGELRSQPHDARIGFLRLFVAAPARRNGVGAALLARIAESARSAGMERIQTTVSAGDAGEAFARGRRGVRELLRLERQEQRLDDDVLDRCRRLATRPAPADYRLAHWHGAAPEPLVASFGQVLGHVLDAPGAAVQLAARAWGHSAVREWETQMAAGGEHLLVCAAVRRGTGQVVAVTVTTVGAADDPAARQHDTAVLPRHRGRGLARWIKAEQTLRLRALFPYVRTVNTTVNRQNLPMVAVNRAVGYRTVGARLLLEASLAACAQKGCGTSPGAANDS